MQGLKASWRCVCSCCPAAVPGLLSVMELGHESTSGQREQRGCSQDMLSAG